MDILADFVRFVLDIHCLQNGVGILLGYAVTAQCAVNPGAQRCEIRGTVSHTGDHPISLLFYFAFAYTYCIHHKQLKFSASLQ